MNQRLVESVAQIVLSMSDDERRLLGRKLRFAGLQQLDDTAEAEKSLQVAEIAQDIREFEQEFEKAYQAPLSDLPAEQWTLPAATSQTEQPGEAAELPSAEELIKTGAEAVERGDREPDREPERQTSF